jgi:AcrR family transcriptional regulator
MTLQRADARRNRARILEAAERVLTERGPTAPTEEIAKAAGVGIGTLFRHFPTKEELLRGVFMARLEKLAEDARELARSKSPGTALSTLIRQSVEQADVKNALASMLTEAGVDVQEATDKVRAELLAALGDLLVAAQQAGAVRPELRVEDLIGLLAGASRAVEYAGKDPAARDRILGVILDGLRTKD